MSTSAVSATGSSLTQAAGSSKQLGKQDFLNLLVKQLQYQDPLNPMDDKDFVAQLAQFSSLEQLTNISTGIDSLIKAQGRQEMMNAVGFIGKEVKASGDTLSKTGTSVSKLYYTIPGDAASVTINVMDASGNIIRSEAQGAQTAGEHAYSWDGKDYNGKTVDDGYYSVGVTTAKVDGTSMMVSTCVTGIVSGVTTDTSGQYVLSTTDGRQVPFTDIKGIVTPAASAS